MTVIFPVFVSGKDVNAEEITRTPVVVAMGDSYSSGEGNEPFYQDLSFDERSMLSDWLCHRSDKAWSCNLTYSDGSSTIRLGDNRGTSFFFVASSGAKSIHITEEEQKKTYCESSAAHRHNAYIAKQNDVFERNDLYGKVDIVLLTIGGNDIGFKDVVTAATIDPFFNWTGDTFLNPDILDNKLEDAWKKFNNGGRDDIKNAYEQIYYEAGPQATIIVAGYPALLSESADVSWYKTEQGIRINENVKMFNEELKKIVEECQEEGIDIRFVDVFDAFVGHEALSDDPYINGIVNHNEYDINQSWLAGPVSSYSFHPNEAGQAAYAAEVQVVFDEVWQEKLAAGVDTTDLTPMYKAYIDLMMSNPDYQVMADSNGLLMDSNNCLLRDLTGDGYPELILGTYDETNELVYSMYTYDFEHQQLRRIMYANKDKSDYGALIGISKSHWGEIVVMHQLDGNVTWEDNSRGNASLMYQYDVLEYNGKEWVKIDEYSALAYDSEGDIYYHRNVVITEEEYEEFADKFWNKYTPLMSNYMEIPEDSDYFKPLYYGDVEDYIDESKSTTFDAVVNYINNKLIEIDGTDYLEANYPDYGG